MGPFISTDDSGSFDAIVMSQTSTVLLPKTIDDYNSYPARKIDGLLTLVLYHTNPDRRPHPALHVYRVTPNTRDDDDNIGDLGFKVDDTVDPAIEFTGEPEKVLVYAHYGSGHSLIGRVRIIKAYLNV